MPPDGENNQQMRTSSNLFVSIGVTLKVSEHWDAGEYVGLVYRDRMRTVADKRCVDQVFSSIFGTAVEAYDYKVKVFDV